MFPATTGLLNRETRSDWVRIRTLIVLRWMAVAGQAGAIAVAWGWYQMQLPMGLCLMAVGASVVANLLSMFLFPENARLKELQAFGMLLFDVTQLSALVFLTGGLTNPFALLILAPVTISAAALDLRTTVALAIIAIAMITVNAAISLPLRFADGTVFAVPRLFGFGFWLSIVIGILFLGLYSRRVATEIRSMSDALLATQMALAREQKLTDLGGVVAAAAHELGTPLATIKLVSTELIEELSGNVALQDDARLIRDQANRCRDILQSMGRAGKDDRYMQRAPLETILQEAAEPHMQRGKSIMFSMRPAARADLPQPLIFRSAEIVHGIRNLVQNAVDFAQSQVWISAEWSDETITLRIADNGDGYPTQILGRIGDPFVRSRREDDEMSLRPAYEGMGLGLFIAKTLLERSGAELTFANGSNPLLPRSERPERCGAIVEVVWPAARIIATPDGRLGENPLIVQ